MTCYVLQWGVNTGLLSKQPFALLKITPLLLYTPLQTLPVNEFKDRDAPYTGLGAKDVRSSLQNVLVIMTRIPLQCQKHALTEKSIKCNT